MARCHVMETCSLLKDMLAYAPDLAEETKQAYCHEEPGACARYMLLDELGSEYVPANILPGDANRARELILQARQHAAGANSA